MKGEGKFIDKLMTGDLAVTGRLDASNTNRVCVETFRTSPVCTLAAGGAPSGTAVTANLALTADGNMFEYVALGTQTLTGMGLIAATGLNVAGDQTDDDGREINFGGGLTAKAPIKFVVGSAAAPNKAFYGKLKFSIGTVLGTDDCSFGFREQDAYNGTYDNFTDLVSLNVNAGNILIETIVGNAATVTTDTTNNWADGETHTLEVYVSATGVVTYKIDGVAPVATAALTMTSGLTVVPFFFFLNAAGLTGTLVLQYFECGYTD